MTQQEVEKILDRFPVRSAWERGVKALAADLLDSDFIAEGRPCDEKSLLNGAFDWLQWSYGGCGMIFDTDIAERFCTPSELKRKHGGELEPNRRETWLDVQARAARQAARKIVFFAQRLQQVSA